MINLFSSVLCSLFAFLAWRNILFAIIFLSCFPVFHSDVFELMKFSMPVAPAGFLDLGGGGGGWSWGPLAQSDSIYAALQLRVSAGGSGGGES